MIRPLLIHLGFSILVCVSSVGAYWLWNQMLVKENTEFVSVGAQIDAKSMEIARASATKNELKNLSADQNDVEGYFLSAGDIVSFLEHLEKTGPTLNSTVSVLSVGTDQGSGSPSQLKVTVKIAGTFESVMKTLGVIEYGPYDISIADMTLGSASNTGADAWAADVIFVVGLHPDAPSSTP